MKLSQLRRLAKPSLGRVAGKALFTIGLRGANPVKGVSDMVGQLNPAKAVQNVAGNLDFKKKIKNKFVNVDLFFDGKKVMNAVDKAARNALSRFGAFVRQRARSLIRSRKRASLPGEPPSSHTGYLKNNIFFSYEPASQSVVIGPVPIGGGHWRARRVGTRRKADRPGRAAILYACRPAPVHAACL